VGRAGPVNSEMLALPPGGFESLKKSLNLCDSVSIEPVSRGYFKLYYIRKLAT
jgi:hypothetical protein